jgi:superfamily II DNA or RNA helicase
VNYKQFLASKKISDVPTGFDPDAMPKQLFDFQADCVRWACRRGRAALFEDCGLGKTPQQLVWAEKVCSKSDKPVLILAPLCVTQQTKREGKKFGIEVNIACEQSDVKPGINVSNYEKLHHFNPDTFGGVVLDESSILKSYDGATRNLIISSFRNARYKLACTATPAPNDFMELGNHAEFLGVMSRVEMLATFFVHDGGDTSKWRLKGHAEKEFWKWLCSWAINIRKPSDLGYQDKKFKLPKLNLQEHIVQSTQKMDGYLFALPASSLGERRDARRASLAERVELAAALAANKEQWVFWCNLNSESESLAKIIGASEISGATPDDERERIAAGFLDGSIRCVVTKPSLWGYGMNLQCCHNTALVGLSDSYEDFYQVVRRFWRFGQTQEVNAHIIISSLEGAVLANIKRKESDARRLADEMIRNMSDISAASIRGSIRETEEYKPAVKMQLPEFLNA